ncbi:MAG TPA: hypothetical protein VFR05_09480 [Terriglobia bacterium]|nr:hypothetical protein [Terriglobia bacterium]
MRRALSVTAACSLVIFACSVWGQGPPAGFQPAAAGRGNAPFDLTGYWVGQVTEDWRYRMATAPKGDVGGIPVSAEGRKVAAAWDPEKDAASEDACKAYGVGGVMRMPGRLHITWESADTLKIETEAGAQTRLLAFGKPLGQGNDWQGVSVATWDRPAPALRGFSIGRGGTPGASLKVVTTKARPGYLMRNGVPYGANATFTEYYDLLQIPGGDTLLVVTVEVVDTQYLSQPYLYSFHFKKQADATGWNLRPCAR